MSAKKLGPPEPPDLPDDLALFEPTLNLCDGLEGVRWSAGGAPGSKAAGLSVSESVLQGIDLSGSTFHNLTLRDVDARAVNFANVNARGATFDRVAITSSRLTGLLVAEGVLRNVRIEGCRADLTAFNGGSLESVSFLECQLTHVSFEAARLRGVGFVNCDLSGADLRGARFDRCHMRSCKLDGVSGLTSLQGVSMPLADVIACADLFASALGITVSED